jgi:hypothetical protein
VYQLSQIPVCQTRQDERQAPALQRGNDLAWIRGTEDEDRPAAGVLQELQKNVLGFRRSLLHFVHNDHPVFTLAGHELCFFGKPSSVSDLAVVGSILFMKVNLPISGKGLSLNQTGDDPG